MGKYTTKVTQSDIDNNLDSAKVIVVDQTKGSLLNQGISKKF